MTMTSEERAALNAWHAVHHFGWTALAKPFDDWIGVPPSDHDLRQAVDMSGLKCRVDDYLTWAHMGPLFECYPGLTLLHPDDQYVITRGAVTIARGNSAPEVIAQAIRTLLTTPDEPPSLRLSDAWLP